MLTEISGSVRWEILCAVSYAIAGIRGKIREDLVYISRDGRAFASSMGVAVDLVFDRGHWFCGYTEARAEFQWNLGQGAHIRARDLHGTELWNLEYLGPSQCTYHRIVRDALMASATELLPG